VVASRKTCPRIFVPFSRWRLRYLACFSALVKAMDAVSGALQSVTGTYEASPGCRRKNPRPLPKKKPDRREASCYARRQPANEEFGIGRSNRFRARHFGTELGTPKPADFALETATSVRSSTLFDPMMRTSFAPTSTR
jgi:hypothetical protein